MGNIIFCASSIVLLIWHDRSVITFLGFGIVTFLPEFVAGHQRARAYDRELTELCSGVLARNFRSYDNVRKRSQQADFRDGTNGRLYGVAVYWYRYHNHRKGGCRNFSD